MSHKAKQRIRSDPGALFVFMGFIEMLSSFLAYISMRLSNSSAKMEFNSRLDDKITACGENQKWQSVTPQYLFSGVHLC